MSDNTVQCVFEGGNSNNFMMYGKAKPLYVLPVLCPEKADDPSYFIKDGVFQFYEVYSLKHNRKGQAVYQHTGLINLKTVKLIQRNPQWRKSNGSI